jgi:hypothetical protein
VHDAFAWLRAHPLAANDPLRHIMLDVDGIIFPFHRAQASHLPGSPSPESIIDTWGAVKEKYPLAVHVAASGYAHSKAAILRFGLFEGAAAGIRLLQDYDLCIHICTRRESEHAQPTSEALQELGLHFTSYVAGPDLDKLAICHARGLGIIVDDKPELMIAAAVAGVPVFSLRWPYNRHLQGRGNITLARSWTHLAPAILASVQYLARTRSS